MSNYVEMLKNALDVVKGKPVYKRFIKSTPLENDIACWMVDFATQHVKEKQAEIDALKAQRDELLAAQEWRDIESAPKNQTVLLSAEFAGEGDWRIKCGYFCSERNFWCIWGASWTPTYWQPLPPPPIAKATGEKS